MFDHLFFRCIIWLSTQIKKVFQICTLRDCPFNRIFKAQGVCNSLILINHSVVSFAVK